jgi:peroxiredoxin
MLNRASLCAVLLLSSLGCTSSGDDPDGGSDTDLDPNLDSDADGIPDVQELEDGTDPDDPDSDDDGLSDLEEAEAGTDPLQADSDADGLDDGDELVAGTDPLQADSDGDGFNDGEEVAAGTDPTDWISYERTTDGRWPDLSGYAEGTPGQWAIGERVPDFTATDQFDQQVTLEQFYGNVILVTFGAGWCGPCRSIAQRAEDLYRDRADDGFLVIHYMVDDDTFDQTVDDPTFLAAWADQYGLTFPVVHDDTRGALTSAQQTGLFQGGIPFVVLLDRQLRVSEAATGSGADETVRPRADVLLDQ